MTAFLCVVSLIIWIVCGLLAVFVMNVKADSCNLPSLVYLGEDVGTYQLPQGYSFFVVKQWNPNYNYAVYEGLEMAVTESMNGPQNHKARVWASTQNILPVWFFDTTIELGDYKTGDTLKTIIIDDDHIEPDGTIDSRLTTVENEDETILQSFDPNMVQEIDIKIPHNGKYYIASGDSIAFWPICVVDAPTPTQPPTLTSAPTSTPTPTVTNTPTTEPTPTYPPTGLTPQAEPVKHKQFLPVIYRNNYSVGEGPTIP